MMSAGLAVPSTPIELVSRLTEQAVTPGTLPTAFSTRALQAAQLIPVTLYCSIVSSLRTGGLLHQPLDHPHQFVHSFVVAGLQVVHHAGADVLAQQLFAKAVQRLAHRRRLEQAVGAVSVLFHHAADAPDLALHPDEPVDEILVFLRGAVTGAGSAAGSGGGITRGGFALRLLLRGGKFGFVLHSMDLSFRLIRTKGGRPWGTGGVQPARHTRRGYLCLYYSTVCAIKQEGKYTDTPYPCEKTVKAKGRPVEDLPEETNV